MVHDFSSLQILFEMTLFGLFLFKFYSLFKQYGYPSLKKYQEDMKNQWVSLQEQHADFMVQKKALASQFLQQEKQLSLLAAKLEKWHQAWLKNEEQKHHKQIENIKISRQKSAEQYRTFCKKKQTEKIILNIIGELKKEALTTQKIDRFSCDDFLKKRIFNKEL